MGYGLKPVPFWTEDFSVGRVVEATHLEDFDITKLADLGVKRLNHAYLGKRDDNGHFIIEMRDGSFIEFERG